MSETKREEKDKQKVGYADLNASDLVARISIRVGKIPASNPGYISMRETTLADIVDRNLLHKIAQEAADEILSALRARSQQ